MSEEVRRIMDHASDAMATIPQEKYENNDDYIINEYMERLGTRLNILETELKYAWRALDLLSQEYIKMWERLEKLEGLLYEQQSVISQLLDYYTSGGVNHMGPMAGGATALLEGRLGELEVIREILGNGTVEDGLEEGLDVTVGTSHSQTAVIQELDVDSNDDEFHVPDEAFYRSLNQAYREDLVGCDSSAQANQLDLIWEEKEESDDVGEKNDDLRNCDASEEVYSSMDYREYKGNSPCVSEQDLAQLSRIDSIDHVAIEKLNELDRLSNKLQQDSANIKQLQRKLMESPLSMSELPDDITDSKERAESIDDHIRQIFVSNNWSFSSEAQNNNDIMLIAKSELPNSISNLGYSNRPSSRPSSRLSVSDSVAGTDNEVAEVFAANIRTPTSPRRRTLEINTCSAPFTTVTGRLAYSNAVQHVENAEAAAALHNSKNPFYCSASELGNLMAASFETVANSSPTIYNAKSEKTKSPTLSICSIRTRQDGYIGSNDKKDESSSTSTPPPPAPREINLAFDSSCATSDLNSASAQVFLGTHNAVQPLSISSKDRGHLSPKTPHSPRSPKTSPKRYKSHSANIVAAKSDSGLSSMSGWSSLEKSPGSPKNGSLRSSSNYGDVNSTRHSSFDMHYRNISPAPSLREKQYLESDTDSKISSDYFMNSSILPGGHHLSAFTSVKSPCGLETSEGYGTFVPAPAPASDINVSPRRKSNKHQQPSDSSLIEYMYKNDQPAIYSVAGNNTHTYASVYTSNSADYINQTINYPDLIEPYENNECQNVQRLHAYNSSSATTNQNLNMNFDESQKALIRGYATTNVSTGISSHDNFKPGVYHTMYPPDALTYYTATNRYESELPEELNAEYNEVEWACNQHDGDYREAHFNRPTQSQTDYRKSPFRENRQINESRIINQPIYENQAQIDQYNKQWSQRQEIPYLELDLRNRNTPDYVPNVTNSDTSKVIITQSGYISISSNMTESQGGKKKLKRGNTLKSAMNSVSHWLPDLHLPKRSRSYSLPSGAHRQEVESTRRSLLKSTESPRKKKKNAIVSTVSGIFQKAKRKAYNHHRTHSLSDPEQSEHEWILKRANSLVTDIDGDRSEDSSSLISENNIDRDNLFQKISTVQQKVRKSSQQEIGEKSEAENDHKSEVNDNKNDITENFQTQDLQVDNFSSMQSKETEISQQLNEDNSTSLFSTIGETKRNSGSSDKNDESTTEPKMKIPVCNPSMEFAVSRALGKYRQRQSSSSGSEDQYFSGEILDDDNSNKMKIQTKHDIIMSHKLSDSNDCGKINDSEIPAPESSPSSMNMRSHGNRFFPRHQQSLEIPGHRISHDDDDNRSTHSWRSTSRVSSRRQSTEDSIDSEDEWYCYELKKLEEMERQSQLEAEMGETLQEEPELEDDSYEPIEEVKERMSFVLRELRMKAKLVEGVLNEKENNLHVVQSAKRRGSSRMSTEFESSIFAKVKPQKQLTKEQDEEQVVEFESYKGNEDDQIEEEHSSGDTSGPDSPHQSTDEYEENEAIYNKAFARCTSISEKDRIEEVKQDVPETETTSSGVPKITINESVQHPKENEESKDAAGPLGSKWKLLKALKEKKAEEREKITDKTTETPTERDKVSMLGMMQKFYEVHVRT
ncbi:hypothetical protein WA026_011385 [Henosepilachna vigintioctopunctata]|uniref:Uncharacterized protein n=1 Tax=Henosepilachna vigintioctopunctata TaxID=420089 RepID=A0AAW1TSH9_9CUCU